MDFLDNCGLRPIYTNKEYMNSVKPKLKYHKFDMSKFNLIKEQHIDSSINKLKNNNNKKNKQLISFTYIYDFILNNKENQYSVDINGFTSSESESDHDSDYEYYSN